MRIELVKNDIGESGLLIWRDGSGLYASLASMKMGINVHRTIIKCEHAQH